MVAFSQLFVAGTTLLGLAQQALAAPVAPVNALRSSKTNPNEPVFSILPYLGDEYETDPLPQKREDPTPEVAPFSEEDWAAVVKRVAPEFDQELSDIERRSVWTKIKNIFKPKPNPPPYSEYDPNPPPPYNGKRSVVLEDEELRELLEGEVPEMSPLQRRSLWTKIKNVFKPKPNPPPYSEYDPNPPPPYSAKRSVVLEDEELRELLEGEIPGMSSLQRRSLWTKIKNVFKPKPNPPPYSEYDPNPPPPYSAKRSIILEDEELRELLQNSLPEVSPLHRRSLWTKIKNIFKPKENPPPYSEYDPNPPPPYNGKRSIQIEDEELEALLQQSLPHVSHTERRSLWTKVKNIFKPKQNPPPYSVNDPNPVSAPPYTELPGPGEQTV